jgi:hypothetical protein
LTSSAKKKVLKKGREREGYYKSQANGTWTIGNADNRCVVKKLKMSGLPLILNQITNDEENISRSMLLNQKPLCCSIKKVFYRRRVLFRCRKAYTIVSVK